MPDGKIINPFNRKIELKIDDTVEYFVPSEVYIPLIDLLPRKYKAYFNPDINYDWIKDLI